MVTDSVETWRLYSAEASVPLSCAPFATVTTARQFLAAMQASRWWRWNVRADIAITLDDVGNEVGGQVNSYTRPHGEPPASWTISMHPEQLDAYHLLHEVAHCIAPRWRWGGTTAPSAIPAHRELPFHGPEFAGTRLAITKEFAHPAEADALIAAFEHFKVGAATWEQIRDDIADSEAAEADLVSVRSRPNETEVMGAVRRLGRPVSPGDLGDLLRVARYRAPCHARADGTRRHPTQAQLAKRIADVVPCTSRDVSRVENLRHAPLNRRNYQVALCLAALLNLDPVQVQFQLGLDREEWDVPLDDLAQLNPDWVELVRELDDLIRQRPPRWYSNAKP